MMGDFEVREMIDDLFEEQALSIGGMVAVYGADDDFVCKLMSNIAVIREKVLRRIEIQGDDEEPLTQKSILRPHPAIEKFLRSLGRD